MTMLTIAGGNVILARDLTPADDGMVAYTVMATQNGVTVSTMGTIAITPVVVPPSVPTSVMVSPSSATLPDNSMTGAQVAAVTVTTSDGSPFVGNLDISGPV